MKKERLFWGMLFILGAIFLIVKNLGFFPDVNIFSLLLSVFLIAIIIQSIPKLSFSGIFFPLAFLFIIYDEVLGVQNLSHFTVLLAALFGTIGFSIIFKKNNFKFYKSNIYKVNELIETTEDESNIKYQTSFSSSVRYINSNNFVSANLSCSFGSMSIYFNNATMENETALVNIDADFSGIELYIPKEWKVEDRINLSFSGLEEHNKSDIQKTNTLILVGDISFSGVDIFYV